MSQVINTNIASITAQRNLNETSGALQQSIERLSSGLRINSAADDAAGLAISERFSAQIGGLNQAQQNSQDGISFSQTAEGALEEIGNIAQRVRELAVQSANDTNSASDREALNEEVQQLTSEANRIAETTAFNNQNVLDGSLEELVFQVGANEGETIDVTGADARSSQLGTSDVTTSTALGEAVDINSLSDTQSFQVNGQAFTFSSGGGDPESGSFGSQAELAEAINAADFGGAEDVSAAQANEVVADLGSLTTGTSNEIVINDETVTVDDVSTGIDNINAVSGITGVTASENDSDNITLSNETGDPIEINTNGGDASFDNVDDSGATELQAAVTLSVDSTDTSDLVVNEDGGSLAQDLGLNGTVEPNEFSAVDVSTREDASNAITTVDAVIDQVNGIRGDLGAVQNRFESTISNLGVTVENLEASRSRIVDADFASETAQLTQNQILQQAGTSVLGQANQIPQNVVSLLQ